MNPPAGPQDLTVRAPQGYVTLPPPAYGQAPPPAPQQRSSAALALALILGLIIVLALTAGALYFAGVFKSASRHTQSASPSSSAVAGTSTPAPSTTTSAPSFSGGSGALAAVNDHWRDISDGDYAAAYGYLSSSAVDGASQSDWVTSHQQDGITSVQYSFRLTWVSGEKARVDINRLQTDARTNVTPSNADGCTHFIGYYILLYQGGSWSINEVHLTQIPSCT